MGMSEVNRVTNRFLESIVRVVAKRPDLRFELDSSKKFALRDNEEIPLLRGAEVPRKHGV